VPSMDGWLDQYRGVAKSLGLYWKTYGGARTLIRSPYLHAAAFLTVLIAIPMWNRAAFKEGWYDTCLTVVPSLLGFTLGGYAILMAFGDERFRRAISGPDPDGTPSPFMVVNAAFVHFIVIQAVSLLVALVSKAWEWKTGIAALVGLTLLIYAIFAALAAALAILNLASWFDRYNPPQ